MKKLFRILIALMALGFLSGDFYVPFSTEATAAVKKSANKKRGNSTYRRKGTDSSAVKLLYNDTATGEWIRRGKRNIIIHHDTAGNLRAMAAFSMRASAGKEYAEAINNYAALLKPGKVKVYSLVAPTQGNYYMPPQITDNLSESETIHNWTRYLSSDVTPVLVADALGEHVDENIYSRTDHHWAPLGAFYAAEQVARTLNRPFVPLSEYGVDTVKNYVGTMWKFSGDADILHYPENFIYYTPPGDYKSEFIDYTIKKNNVAATETPIHEAPLLRKYRDGSGSAYSTFLGGDYHTVKVTNHKDKSGRKLLIVKDSFGNALVPYLVNSFQEVHVIDFRHYPHSLTKYIRDNNITDLIFVNCIELAFTKSTSQRLKQLMH